MDSITYVKETEIASGVQRNCKPHFDKYFPNDRWTKFIENFHRITLGYKSEKGLKDSLQNVQVFKTTCKTCNIKGELCLYSNNPPILHDLSL